MARTNWQSGQTVDAAEMNNLGAAVNDAQATANNAMSIANGANTLAGTKLSASDLAQLHVRYNGSWPNRPSLPTTVTVTWIKADPANPDPTIGGSGMGPNDLLLRAVE